ncbi:hypothetical protein DOTSEDRAFT_76716 [Dothistroma septosporum NZE10]|uniref:Uncharacterized protein n=1 Tax=Dothistroma septosporum (strain NZE10 / CBS 128990) TaxID=675120 RepID=N1Q3X6_DOTSN|nr:hypothetical protein DOTSEDRAFT_76716 [Dothistroma septosporum NZE10]
MLWTGTNVLVSHKNLDVNIHYQPSKYRPGRTNDTEDVVISAANGDSTYGITVQSKELITAHLLAAIESRCTAFAKTVMNEIERRLLQRQQVSRTSTFMSAIILLNSVERMTGLYWTHDPDLSLTTHDSTSPLAWPLDTTPHKFWLQGEHFADVLIMLLRMRGLPPKTITMQNGCLVAVPDQPSRGQSDARRSSARSEGQSSLPAEWLDSLELKTLDLLRVRDDGVRDSSAGARAFDLAFISKVLLPPSK